MIEVDLIIRNIKEVLTCHADEPKRGKALNELNIRRHCAIAIKDGRFLSIKSEKELLDKYSAKEIIDAKGGIILPGFVDPHTHIVYAGNRLDEFEQKISGADYLEILASGGGILSTVKQTREASLDNLTAQSFNRLCKMIQSGTTTCEVKTGYGLSTRDELKMLKVIEKLYQLSKIDIVPTLLAAHAMPKEFASKRESYIHLICEEVMPQAKKWYDASVFASESLPIFVDVFCEKSAFTVREMKLILEKARSLGFGLKAHTDQFTNLGGSEAAINLKAASIDHLDEISEPEIKLLAKSETVGIITPMVNVNSGSSKFANARKLINEGSAIALATDYNPGSSPCSSMQIVISLSTRYLKLTPAEALNAATLNAAYSVGLGGKVGSIAEGKKADFLIYDCEDYREIAYEIGGVYPRFIFKNGALHSAN